MKQSQDVVETRRQEIIQLLQAQPTLSLRVNDIAKKLSVSPMTIRRDLAKLESMGKLVRSHGCAQLLEEPSYEGNTFNTYIEAIKKRIAATASKFVDNDMTLFINSSSTALLTMDYFTEHSLIVVTNNAHIINSPHHSNLSVMLSGGEVRLPKNALVGDFALSTLSNVQADITILGCSGISLERGITTINIHESAVNALMIQNTSKKVIVVADYRKIGHNASFTIADVDRIDVLITDTHADWSILEKFEKMGIQVIQVPV